MLLDERTYPIHRVLEKYLEPHQLAYALRLWSQTYILQRNISLQGFVDAFYFRQSLEVGRYELYSELLPAMMMALDARNALAGRTAEGYEFPDLDRPEVANTVTYPASHQIDQAHPPAAAISTRPAQPGAAIPGQLVTPVNTSTNTSVASPVHATTGTTPDVATVVAAQAPAATAPVAPKPDYDERMLIFSTFIRRLLQVVPTEKCEKMIFRSHRELIRCCESEIAQAFYDWLRTDEDYFAYPALDNAGMSNAINIIYAGLCNYIGPVKADQVLMKTMDSIADEYADSEFSIEQVL